MFFDCGFIPGCGISYIHSRALSHPTSNHLLTKVNRWVRICQVGEPSARSIAVAALLCSSGRTLA